MTGVRERQRHERCRGAEHTIAETISQNAVQCRMVIRHG